MVNDSGTFEGKAQQNIPAPILDLAWTEDGSKIFVACADKEARLWDLASNQVAVVGTHDGPIRTCHWINGNNYQCLMTGSFDKTLRFWDMKNLPQQTQMASIQLPERVYAADVVYPMAVVALANKHIKVYNLENGPTEVKDIESQLKFQIRCIAIFKDKTNQNPAGFALGSIEGRVAVQYVEAANPKDNFTFKCHRSAELVNGYQEIYAVNDISFHPQHGTLVTIGSDGRYSMWDKDARTKLKTSDPHPMPLTCCDVHSSGAFLVYALGYDWSRVSYSSRKKHLLSSQLLFPGSRRKHSTRIENRHSQVCRRHEATCLQEVIISFLLIMFYFSSYLSFFHYTS